MSNHLKLYKLMLSDNEMYDNWLDYLNMISNDALEFDFDFKTPTSMMNPSVIITGNLGTISHYNYAQIFIDDDIGSWVSRCYNIRDIISINLHQCELVLDFDAFRSINWRNPNTRFKLAYSTDERRWAQTIIDPRFEPYASYGTIGTNSWRYETGIPAKELADQDDETGLYLVKWWWGKEDGVDSYGNVYGMMNVASFNFFISKVNHFIEDHWGSQLSGISDFTKFIISAKYFPSLNIDKCRRMAGYSNGLSLVGVGGLCVVDATEGYTAFRCYIKRDRAGFIDSYFEDDEDKYFEARPLGYKPSSSSDEAKINKMKWLTDSKWCQYIIKTPVGIGSIDMSTIRNGDKLFYNAQIDFETGIMTFNVMRNKSDALVTTRAQDADILLSLQGPVYYDMIGQFTHIQSANEVLINSFTSSMISSASAYVGGLGNVSNATASNPSPAMSPTLGMASEMAQAPFKAVESLMSPRVINQPRSSGGDNLYWLHRNNDSLKYFYVRTTVFMNPDTPLYDDETPQGLTGWNARVLYEKYRDYCRTEGNGYPSIAACNFDSTFLDSGTTWFKCSEVFEIRSTSGDWLLITPQMEAQIKTMLLSGVTIHPGPI